MCKCSTLCFRESLHITLLHQLFRYGYHTITLRVRPANSINVHIYYCWRFSSNSEAKASELLENLEVIFLILIMIRGPWTYGFPNIFIIAIRPDKYFSIICEALELWGPYTFPSSPTETIILISRKKRIIDHEKFIVLLCILLLYIVLLLQRYWKEIWANCSHPNINQDSAMHLVLDVNRCVMSMSVPASSLHDSHRSFHLTNISFDELKMMFAKCWILTSFCKQIFMLAL